MRVFFSECAVDYSTYTFPYAVYCLKERQEELPAIYAQGFLPYTGMLSLAPEVFYLARSLRVDLSRFADTSENRRVDRKAAELQVTLRPAPKSEINTAGPALREFCTGYAEERFAGGTMDDARLAYVLSRDTLTHILEFTSGGKLLGYVFASVEGEMLHYWYSFFDTEYLSRYSLGKWMMWRTIRWAQEQGLRYVYLGTCYKGKGLYKARDHKGVEFFDGMGWNPDVKLLAELCHRDDEAGREEPDLFKQPGGAAVFRRVTS